MYRWWRRRSFVRFVLDRWLHGRIRGFLVLRRLARRTLHDHFLSGVRHSFLLNGNLRMIRRRCVSVRLDRVPHVVGIRHWLLMVAAMIDWLPVLVGRWILSVISILLGRWIIICVSRRSMPMMFIMVVVVLPIVRMMFLMRPIIGTTMLVRIA